MACNLPLFRENSGCTQVELELIFLEPSNSSNSAVEMSCNSTAGNSTDNNSTDVNSTVCNSTNSVEEFTVDDIVAIINAAAEGGGIGGESLCDSAGLDDPVFIDKIEYGMPVSILLKAFH